MKQLALLLVLLGVVFCPEAQAAEPTRFHLLLNRPPPAAGDEAERTIQIFTTTSDTNVLRGREEITNGFNFFELQGREKILSWDVTGDWSKVDLTVKHLIAGHASHTNELVKPGTRLTGTSIAGETFFSARNETISEDAYQQLKQSYPIRPRDFNELAGIKTPPSVAAGDSWEITTPMNLQAMSILGSAYTNGIKATGQFVGITNLFGLDCFHLRISITSTNTPEFLRQMVETRLPVKINTQVTITADLIEPLDASQKSLWKSFLLDLRTSSEMVVDGKNVMSSHGRMTLKIISQFQFVPH